MPSVRFSFDEEVALLVVDAGRAERRDGLQAVDGDHVAVLVLLLLDEVLLAGVVVALGDLLVHPLQRLLLPLLRAGRAVERLGRPQRVVGELDGRRALGAEPAQRVRRVRVALDVDDLAVLGVDQLTAADRAVRTDAGEGLRLLDLQRRGRRLDGRQVEAGADRHAGGGGAAELQEVTAGQAHGEPSLSRSAAMAVRRRSPLGAGQLFPDAADDDDPLRAGPPSSSILHDVTGVQRGEVRAGPLVADDERLLRRTGPCRRRRRS